MLHAVQRQLRSNVSCYVAELNRQLLRVNKNEGSKFLDQNYNPQVTDCKLNLGLLWLFLHNFKTDFCKPIPIMHRSYTAAFAITLVITVKLMTSYSQLRGLTPQSTQ